MLKQPASDNAEFMYFAHHHPAARKRVRPPALDAALKTAP
jgi:hypothetical protein